MKANLGVVGDDHYQKATNDPNQLTNALELKQYLSIHSNLEIVNISRDSVTWKAQTEPTKNATQ